MVVEDEGPVGERDAVLDRECDGDAELRSDALYFVPQMQTKIMNEGWATFWHSRMMTRFLLHDDELITYCDHHSGTLASGPGHLNPYKIGVELLRDIEERWNKGRFGKEYDECQSIEQRRAWNTGLNQGTPKVFEVRRVHNDVTFIDEFLTPGFVIDQKLFSFGYNPKNDRFEVESRKFAVPGPAGCNMCGGIISETLVQNLAIEGINLPTGVIQRGIQSYVLHTDVGVARIATPLEEMRIGAVHRGAGPKDAKEQRWESFDLHLQQKAIAAETEWLPVLTIGAQQVKQASVMDSGDLNQTPGASNGAAAAVVGVVSAIPLLGTTLHTWNRWVPAEVQQTYGTEYARLTVTAHIEPVRVAAAVLVLIAAVLLTIGMVRTSGPTQPEEASA